MASIMEGPLSKWTNVMKGWQYRWFVLDYNAGLLSYYTSKDKMMRGSRRGCVRLRGAVIGIDDEDDSTFTITVDQKTFHFQGVSDLRYQDAIMHFCVKRIKTGLKVAVCIQIELNALL